MSHLTYAEPALAADLAKANKAFAMQVAGDLLKGRGSDPLAEPDVLLKMTRTIERDVAELATREFRDLRHRALQLDQPMALEFSYALKAAPAEVFMFERCYSLKPATSSPLKYDDSGLLKSDQQQARRTPTAYIPTDLAKAATLAFESLSQVEDWVKRVELWEARDEE